jgi:hypothetical protein
MWWLLVFGLNCYDGCRADLVVPRPVVFATQEECLAAGRDAVLNGAPFRVLYKCRPIER